LSDDRVKEIIAYHNRTKHGFNRLAASAGYLDWENQPLPFRFYEDAPRFSLPLDTPDPDEHHLALYRRSSKASDFNTVSLAKFLELSLGLSAWKELSGDRWSLRMNPSSGNLHPTECHLILPTTENLNSGLYHYDSFGHALECRAALTADSGAILRDHFGADGFLTGLSNIFWREAWKYGERAYRYCNHDTGHALASLSFSAALLGWKVTCLSSAGQSEVASVLGLDRTEYPRYEEEWAERLCFVATSACPERTAVTMPVALTEKLKKATFTGTPNKLSHEHREWSVIHNVAEMATRPSIELPTEPPQPAYGTNNLLETSTSPLKAADIIRKRRSAWEFSREQSVTERSEILCMLDRTLPRADMAPFDIGLGPVRVQLVLFVHNVSGLKQGLYAFLRDDSMREELTGCLSDDFAWEQADSSYPLYLLREGDFRSQAIALSCNQQIAGSGAFSVAMVARFSDSLQDSPWVYPQLFQECGQLGQALYLEAEAHGLRGTGIGCYFDNPVHELLGLEDNRWQSMYHFTVGVPIEDERLKTYPPYFHLKRGS
jgi:SagB-type dehydrogenase family enzyme